VNPVAGLGGRVGLKGTDGMVDEAFRRGAVPVSADRARECLEFLRAKGGIEFLTASGDMGGSLMEELGFAHEEVHSFSGRSGAQDTIASCERFFERDVGLVVFCGGDGTARDVYSVVEHKIPMLGIPAGVKMHSGVFAASPKAAGELILDFLGADCELKDGEVMDVDEEKYRQNVLETRLFGYALTPYKPWLLQAAKVELHGRTDEEAKQEIAEFASEFMADGSAYILGGGTTTKAIADRLGVEKTLLGVDAVKGGRLLAKDAGERELLEVLKKERKVKIIVSPIGAQGFIFGRGSQQISSEVIRKVGADNVIIVATPDKLNSVESLRVDTGDPKLDRELSGYRRVVIGYQMAQRKDVAAV